MAFQNKITATSNSALFLHIAVTILLTFCCWDINIVNAATIVPKDFQDEYVSSKIPNAPTDFAFTPDGRLLVINKIGHVYVIPNPDKSDDMVLALDMSDKVCDNGGRGLGTISVHPDFVNNQKIYLFWTYKKHGNCELDDEIGPIDRVSQFILRDNNKISWNTEKVILNTPELAGFRHHFGCIEFDHLGYMWLTHGDGHLREASDKDNNLFAKLIRLTPDGDIPDDNPYAKVGDKCSQTGRTKDGNVCAEIYASGLRNPFRCAIDPHYQDSSNDKNAVRLLFNDVGEAHWEEISECITSDGCAKSHFGWPSKEGPCDKGITQGKLCKVDDKYVDPIHYFEHNGNDAAVVGGTFVTKQIGWPSSYDKCYFYGEHVNGDILCAVEGSDNYCRDCNTPRSNYDITSFASGINRLVSIGFGPYKKDKHALYYIYRGGGGGIRRIVYIGSDGNQNPIAKIDTEDDITTGLVGSTIKFYGRNSKDPDGNNDDLTYKWDLDGDGNVDKKLRNPSFTYNEPGLYDATLTVTDRYGGTDTTSIQIQIGTKPEPEILAPDINTKFAVDDEIVLTGRAYTIDPANPNDKIWLDDSEDTKNLCWEVLQHHNTHTHPWLEYTCGNNIKIARAPRPEDFYAATNSYLGITLVAITNDGVKKATTQSVNPRKVKINFQCKPPDAGLFIKIDGTNVAIDNDDDDKDGIEITAWENDELPIEAFDQCSDKTGLCYTFTSWSDNGPRLHTIDIQSKGDNPTYVVTFNIINQPTSEPTSEPTSSEPTPGPTTMEPTEVPTDKATDELISPQPSTSQSTSTKKAMSHTIAGLKMNLIGIQQTQTPKDTNVMMKANTLDANTTIELDDYEYQFLNPSEVEIFEQSTNDWIEMYYNDLWGTKSNSFRSTIIVTKQEPAGATGSGEDYGVSITYKQHMFYLLGLDDNKMTNVTSNAAKAFVLEPFSDDELLYIYVDFLQKKGNDNGVSVFDEIVGISIGDANDILVISPAPIAPNDDDDIYFFQPTTSPTTSSDKKSSEENTSSSGLIVTAIVFITIIVVGLVLNRVQTLRNKKV